MIYLDLDRTLFQTKRAQEIWPAIASLYPEVDAEQALAEHEKYFVTMEDMYFHDVSRQLRDYGLEPVEVYESLLETDLADGRFEYDGVGELISSLRAHGQEVTILTFGQDDYQRFKVALCPSLRDVPVITTLRPKYEFLEAVVDEGFESVWVVDDKPIGDELSGLASFVQVSLDGEPVPQDVSWPVFHSLHEVKEFFDEVF